MKIERLTTEAEAMEMVEALAGDKVAYKALVTAIGVQATKDEANARRRARKLREAYAETMEATATLYAEGKHAEAIEMHKKHIKITKALKKTEAEIADCEKALKAWGNALYETLSKF